MKFLSFYYVRKVNNYDLKYFIFSINKKWDFVPRQKDRKVARRSRIFKLNVSDLR